MTNVLTIDNEYIKAEIKGENEVIFKIAVAIAKIIEDFKLQKEKKK